MDSFWDIKTGAVSASICGPPMRRAKLVRGEAAHVAVYPCRNFKIAELGEGNAPGLILKRVGKYDSDGVALVQPLTILESGQCEGYIDLATIPINADLKVDGLDTNDVKSADYMASFGYLNTTLNKWVSSSAFLVTVENNVYRGEEGTPSPGPVHPALHVYSALTGEDDSIASIVTVDELLPKVAFAVVDGVFSVWNLTEGDDEDSPSGGIIRPNDFAATTNEKIWKQVL